MEQANKETKKTLKNAAIPKNILVARAKENKPTPTMENFKSALDDMFDDFSMHPNDMDFACREATTEIFVNYLEIVTSHAVEASIPGKSI